MGTTNLVSLSTMLLLPLLFSAALASPKAESCKECIHEMERFGQMVHDGADVMAAYLADNYCPTIEEEHQEACPDHLATWYPHMLAAVTNRLIVHGAEHMCQAMGACQPYREYTCEECVEGMEFIEAYLEDPIFQGEASLFLQQHWCKEDMPNCVAVVARHFIPMHVMVMEKFMIPQDICNLQPVCGGPTHDPNHTTRPHSTHPTRPHTRPPY